MSNKQDIHKKQFYSKIKTAKKLNSQLINWEKLKLYRLLLNFDEENSKVSKSFKQRIRRINFKLVNMGADCNVVYTLLLSSSVTGKENLSRQVSFS